MAKPRVLVPTPDEARALLAAARGGGTIDLGGKAETSAKNGSAPAGSRHSLPAWMPELAIYHVTSRVVHRQLLFTPEAKEQFRIFMRMYERFTGCRVLSYCVMTNHFHILLEVPPMGEEGELIGGINLGISEPELLYRLGGLYSDRVVASVAEEIAEARRWIEGDYPDFHRLSPEDQEKNRRSGERDLRAIFERYTKRMNHLSQFMKGLLQRFTRWFNKQNALTGTLWEQRFHSVIVESGLACRMMAAYIDLNPVRAGLCTDPEDYRWSSYGEAIGGGRGAQKSRAGLARALQAHRSSATQEKSENSRTSAPSDRTLARAWAQGGLNKDYRKLLLQESTEAAHEDASSGQKKRVITRKGKSREEVEQELQRLAQKDAQDLIISKIIRCRIRYFRDGAIIGGKNFVNGLFELRKAQLGPKRKDGARRPRGALGELQGEIWTFRDLQKGV